MTAVALGLRIPAALHSGAVLVARPRGVVHIHADRLTRSGRAVPATVRPLCRTLTRRLHVVATDARGALVAVQGRRFCRSCTNRLPDRLGSTRRLVSRDDWIAVFGDLTVDDLWVAARWTRTVEETHQVSALATMLHGWELPDLRAFLNTRRRTLATAELTPEEQAEAAARREAADFEQRRIASARASADRLDKAAARASSGGYVAPWDREVLGA